MAYKTSKTGRDTTLRVVIAESDPILRTDLREVVRTVLDSHGPRSAGNSQHRR